MTFIVDFLLLPGFFPSSSAHHQILRHKPQVSAWVHSVYSSTPVFLSYYFFSAHSFSRAEVPSASLYRDPVLKCHIALRYVCGDDE